MVIHQCYHVAPREQTAPSPAAAEAGFLAGGGELLRARIDGASNLYGITVAGGPQTWGTVFKMKE